MLIYANQFYRYCHIILLSDEIGAVLLLPVLTAHQYWCDNIRGATHLYSLCGLLGAAGSWGLLWIFLLLCLYWHSLIYRGCKGVKNKTFLKGLPVYYCLASMVDMRPFSGTHPMSICASRGRVRNLCMSQQSPCLMSKSLTMPVSKAI